MIGHSLRVYSERYDFETEELVSDVLVEGPSEADIFEYCNYVT
jgi:hypothetical protein